MDILRPMTAQKKPYWSPAMFFESIDSDGDWTVSVFHQTAPTVAEADKMISFCFENTSKYLSMHVGFPIRKRTGQVVL